MLLDGYKPTFARKFVALSSHYLHCATPVTAAPLTMACWFSKATTLADAEGTLMAIADTGATAEYFRMVVSESTGGRLDAETRSAIAGANESTVDYAGFAANTWYHAAAVYGSAASRIAYANGTAGTADTVSVTPLSLDTLAIGVLERTSLVQHLTGNLALPAVWSVALSGAEIVSLARGKAPWEVRPESLVYWDWTAAQTEYNRGLQPATYALVNFGTTPVVGPPLKRTITRRALRIGVAAAGGSTIPIFDHHYRMLRAAG